MKYIFNFENRERPIQFNREKLLLSALQEPEQLYYMMDTQYEGIYQAEAVERKRLYGNNSYKSLVKKSRFRFMESRKQMIKEVISQLEEQRISVFRRGFHFYSEIGSDELVPGDMIFISAGDIIPSDIRIIFAKNLEVDQSIYSEHNQCIKKNSSYDYRNFSPENIINISNLCFAGSTVVKGLARGVVLSTGSSTYLSHLLLM